MVVLRTTTGVALVALGAGLAVRPFASLAVLLLLVLAGLLVTAVAELLDLPEAGLPRRLALARAGLALLAAVVLVGWTAAGVAAVVVVVGLTLLGHGALDVWTARRLRGTDRWNALLGGVAAIAFGLLALAWPDVSVVLIGVLFGVRLLLLGARLLAGRRRRHARTVLGSALVAVLALVLLVVGLALDRAAPRPDAFYTAPASVPDAPGVLIRSQPFTRSVPSDARAWRILYTTTRDDGVPAVASGLVVVPRERAADLPVVAWAHGTTGIARGCAPSLGEPFTSGALFALDDVVDRGWALVATDYVGLGTDGPHPYLIGQGEGRSVLDAVRAARQLTDAGLGERTVLWGHSQGGHAALWAGALAPSYAPDVPLDGVAALAPASDLTALVDGLGEMTGGELFGSYVIAAYARAYDDVRLRSYVRPAARAIVEEIAARCLAEPSTLVSVATLLSLDKPIWNGDPTRGPLARRLAENIPAGVIPAPLLVAQGLDDDLIRPAAQEAWVAARCAAGQAIDYREYAGREHVSLVEADSPAIADLLAWTADRLAGPSGGLPAQPPPAGTCPPR
ncbi:lipase family protein [Nocardioides humi]|uniref:Secretory lipase n=1 Tax=Nocardioides humi TaxID=449461 RepID=A0ABN2A9R0_9ACTN|nr:lipase family protein [Nocardioides humi]